MPQIIFPEQEPAQSQRQPSTERNKALSENQHILKSSHTNYETSTLALPKEINNKLESIFRDQDNIQCNREDLKRNQIKLLEMKKKKITIELKNLKDGLSIRLHTAEETMSGG